VRRRLCTLASRLDRIGEHELSDAVERVIRMSQVKPAAQPQIQQLDPKMTTMRGPAGWALLEDDERQLEEAKQVKARPPRKLRPRRDGLSVGIDVVMDTRSKRTPTDDGDRTTPRSAGEEER